MMTDTIFFKQVIFISIPNKNKYFFKKPNNDTQWVIMLLNCVVIVDIEAI